MKTVIVLTLFLFLLTMFTNATKKEKHEFACILTSEKTIYTIGELPKMDVRIINESNLNVYLIGSLDGSDHKWRMPYCYFTIEKPKPDTLVFMRCGNTNPLRVSEFKLIKTKEKFNPYEMIDNGFFSDEAATQKETYRNPGIYKIQFHYVTATQDIRKFIGNFGQWGKDADSVKLKELLGKIPKIDIVSNHLEIQVIP